MKRDGSTIGPKRTKIEAKRTLTKKTRSVQATPPAVKNRRDKAIKNMAVLHRLQAGPGYIDRQCWNHICRNKTGIRGVMTEKTEKNKY